MHSNHNITVIPTVHLFDAVYGLKLLLKPYMAYMAYMAWSYYKHIWLEAIALFQNFLVWFYALCCVEPQNDSVLVGWLSQGSHIVSVNWVSQAYLPWPCLLNLLHSHEQQNIVFRVWMKLKVPLNTGVPEQDVKRFKHSTKIWTFQQTFMGTLEKAQNLQKARADKIVKDLTESKIRCSNKEINNCNNLKCTLTLQGIFIFNNGFHNSTYAQYLSCEMSGVDENQ